MRRLCPLSVVLAVLTVAGPARADDAVPEWDDAVAVLTRWDSTSAERADALSALENAQEHAIDQIRDLLESGVWRARRDALALASRTRPAEYPDLVAAGMQDRNWAVRLEAVKLAADIPADQYSAAEAAVTVTLDDPISKVRLAAYQTVVAHDERSPLLERALADPDPDIAYWAADKRLQHAREDDFDPDERARLIDLAIDLMRQPRWQELDRINVAALLRLGDAAEDALYEAVTAEAPETQEEAIAALSSEAGRAGLGLMLRFVHSPHGESRASAIRHICRHAEAEQGPTLLALLAEVTDIGLRQQIVSALGRLEYKPAADRLIGLIDDPHEQVRRAALDALAGIGDEAVARRLIAMYRAEPQAWRRSPLVGPVARILQHDATDFLLEAVRDTDPSIRRITLQAARSHLDADGRLAVLKRAIRDETEDSVRETAIVYLSGEEAKEVEPELVEILRTGGPGSRRAAAAALGQAGTDSAAGALSAAFNREEEPSVSRAIITGLGATGKPETVPVIEAALQSPDAETRLAAFSALEKLGEPIEDELILRLVRTENDPQLLRKCLSQVLERRLAGPDMLPRLSELMQFDDPSLRHAVVRCIASVPTADAARQLCRAVQDDAYSAVRVTALTEVTRRITERRVTLDELGGALAGVLESDDSDMRRRLVVTLAEMNTPAALPLLMRALRTDREGSVRLAAFEGVRPFADRTMVPELLEAIEDEAHAPTAVALIELLGRLRDPRALPPLKLKLESADTAVQSAAIRALGRFADPSLAPVYIRQLEENPNAEVRLSCLRNLEAAADRRALDVMLRLLDDDNRRIQEAAVAALVRFRDASVARALAEHLLSGGAGPRADPIIALLGEVRLRSVASELFEAADEPVDHRRRKHIYSALGAMRYRPAASALLEAVSETPYEQFGPAAARALGRMPEPERAARLLDVARRTFGTVAQAAAVAAAAEPSEDVVAFLVERVADGRPDDVSHYAPLLAATGGEAGQAALREAFDRTRAPDTLAALCSLLDPGDAASAELLRRAVAGGLPPGVLKAAMRNLGSTPDDVAALRRVLTNDSRRPDVRAAALLEWVRRLPDGPAEEAAAAVREHLASGPRPMTLAAARAAERLAGHHGELLDDLLPHTRGSGDDELGRAAVRSIGAFGGHEKAEGGLIDLLEATDCGELQTEAIRSLGWLRAERAVDKLVALGAAGPPNVRAAAVEALGSVGTERAINGVTAAFEQTENDELRAAAARALGRTGDRGFVPLLSSALAEAPGLDVRAASARALGELGGPDAVRALRAALRQDSGLVREAAVRSLAALADRDQRPAIVDLLDDPDWAVRSAAIEAAAGLE